MLPWREMVYVLKEKVSCETKESPSMMWKRSIVQATMECARATATLALALALVVFATARGCAAADLVIEIPGPGAEQAAPGRYRLDYRPPHGSPAPNYTVPARASTINFQGLPGTKYHFMLYYSNATFADLLTWNQTIITAPEPPTNLTVTLGRNKQATIAWSPPAHGDYSGFRFKVAPLTERAGDAPRNITVEGAAGWTHTLRDLAPGATYQLHAFTLLHDKESAAYASRNFTTRPNTPGKFIVWFRNETTLLVLWQPPYPPGAYTHYKVSIVPPDALESEQYVEKEGEPPGPAQAAFKGLVPGRPYNISVQTVSEPEISAPTTAQYRTVPLRPRNVSVDPATLGETAFTVRWLEPQDESEFERYQVSLAGGGAAPRRLAPVLRARHEPPAVRFERLEPGAHYTVTVKTMSGKVTSWPASAEVTLRPLPVRALQWRRDAEAVLVWWAPADGSQQDEFRVAYHEAGPARDDSSALTVAAANVTLDALLPGRNYTVSVAAVSRGVDSNETAFSVATRPLAPALLAAEPAARALRLAWRSDVTSRQDGYEVRYRRRGAADWAALDTRATNATLAGLFPGAAYELTVAAVSHGLRGERQRLVRATRPLPPLELEVECASSDAARARWRGPPPQDSVVGRYLLQYRPLEQAAFSALDPLPPAAAAADVANMTHGARYLLQLDTGSEDVDGECVYSGEPLVAYHTVRPNPVSNVAQLVDTRNMTLEWPRPGGRVEWYSLRWWPAPADEAEAAADAAEPEAEREAPRAANLTAEAAGRTQRALLDGLRPGRGYGVSIAAHSYDLASDLFTMETRTRPLIQSEMTIVNESGSGDADNDTLPATLKVIYTRTPAAASRFDSYRFRLETAGEAARELARPAGEAARELARPAAGGGQSVVFDGLVPGRLYRLTMWTVSRNVTSHPVQRQARLFPRPIPWLNATAAGARGVQLAWGRPPGDYTDFEVQYLAAADQLRSHYTDRLQLRVDGLRPHTLYTFTVVVRAGEPGSVQAPSRAVSAAATTLEAPPDAPSDFRLTDARPSELTFAWELPAESRHGVLRRFVLQYAAADGAEAATREFGPAARGGSVAGLRPGAAYSFALWGETGAGPGEPARLAHRTAIGPPPRPAAHLAPQEVRRSPATVAVRFRQDYFSPANGNVTAYTLVVAEEPRNDTPALLPAWRDVQRLPRWPPYQVTEPYYPFHSSAVEEFTIGSERCEGGGRAYCNGPLKPGTRYFVKLRAFTAPDKFTDTAYTVVYTEVDNTAWIAGVCGGGAALALAAGAALALRRRRRRAAPAAGAAPAPRASRPVRVQDFKEHYRLMSADSDFRRVQRGVRGAEARGARPAVHGGRPALQPAQEPVHEHPAVRPLALQAAARGRRGGLRLHQRQLRAGTQLAARVHRDAGPAALHARRLLAHGLGVGLARHRHAHALRGEGPREVRPLLALRHAPRLLRRHLRHGAQRVALPRLDRHRADGQPRRRAARAAAPPLHHVARLRRARPAHGAGPLRARLPRALPAPGPGRRAPRRRALQRRRRPLRHLHHAGPRAAAAGRARRHARRLRHGARHAPRARLDGADGAAVHLHPPVHRGRARGPGPGRAAQQPQPQPPPQPRLRRRRGHRRVGHVTAARRRPPPPAEPLHYQNHQY